MEMILIRRWDVERLCVVLPYEVQLLEQIRGTEGRKWHPVEKVWSFPDTEKSIQQLARIIKNHPFRLHPDLKHPYLEKEIIPFLCESIIKRDQVLLIRCVWPK
jgi:hypothetical protein